MKKEVLITIDEYKEAEDYWMGKLSGQLEELNPHRDSPRTPGTRQYVKKNFDFELQGEAVEKLLAVSKHNDLSLYIIIQTLVKILLYKQTHQQDIIIASPVHTRGSQAHNLYVPIRDFIDPRMTFKEFLMKVKQSVIDGYKHEYYPMENIIIQLALEDEMRLSGTACVLENFHGHTFINEIPSSIKNNLCFVVRKQNQTLEGTIIYNSAAIKTAAIRSWYRHFIQVLTAVLNETQTRIADIQLTTEEERKKILYKFNRTAGHYPGDRLIHHLFEEQVTKTPEVAALSWTVQAGEIYEALKPGNHIHLHQVMKSCFRKSSYLYTTSLAVPGQSRPYRIVKTRRHNCVIINHHTWELINRHNGKRTAESIFAGIRHMKIPFIILPVTPVDMLEIHHRWNLEEKKVILLHGQLEMYKELLRLLYNNHLIEFTGFQTRENPAEEREINKINNHVQQKKIDLQALMKPESRLTGTHVLLLGDTPGMATTGLLYLGSYLIRRGIEARCRFTDPSLDYPSLKREIRELLQKLQPAVVAVSMKWFLHIARVIEICRTVKEFSPKIKLVVGGNTASYYWEKIIAIEWVDYVVRGDGEEPLLKICQGAEQIPNTVYKKNGEIIVNPITYVQDTVNTRHIYLSHLDRLLLSPYETIFGTFFIYTHKGCEMNCFYCGGSKEAQEKTFNRTRVIRRGQQEVRKDIIEALPYASTFMFDFDAPNEKLLEYCEKIWEGIELTSHFCIFTNLHLPSPRLIALVNRTFNYVYWNLDIASLSREHRKHLAAAGHVKPQPTDSQIFAFFDACETHANNEIRLNLIAGLPYFNEEHIKESNHMLEHLKKNYTCISELHWARLHAQPGASITRDAHKYHMRSYAVSYEDFYQNSKMNFDHQGNYPGLEEFNYPYIYYNDEQLNSRISHYYSTTNLEFLQDVKKKQRPGKVKEKLSYRELNSKVRCLAGKLRDKGLQPGGIAAIIMENSPELAMGILAVLKAGAAYLPIDPGYPPERIEFMLADSGARVLVTTPASEMTKKINFAREMEIVYVGREHGTHPASAQPYPQPACILARPRGFAYVIYTSGTTGTPKGTLITHQGVLNYISWRHQTYGYTETDVTLQVLSCAFDGFASNFYSPLLSGGTLVMEPASKELEFDAMIETIKYQGVTNLSLVPGMYEVLLDNAGDEALKGLRFVVLAGEETPPALIKKSKTQYPGLQLINEYGPTETTVTAAARKGITEESTAVIGKPIANTRIFILDPTRKPVPVNIVGEVCITGAGTAAGYMNNPELTSAKFIQNPYEPGKRLYLTGDMARWNPDGTIQLQGRIDQQVKIRGHRIELAEIENRLNRYPHIKRAVVTVTAPTRNKRECYLCAYIVAEKVLNQNRLQENLAAALPEYMIPHYFVFLEHIPLTPNGKIDKKMLPEPGIGVTSRKYEPPRTHQEETLTGLWGDVLEIETASIGIDDDFFQLGGHSLKAAILAARIHKTMNVKISLGELFKILTIREQAEYIRQAVSDTYRTIQPVEKKEYHALSSAQKRLYIASQLEAASTAYNSSLIVEFQGNLKDTLLEETFKKLINRHESFRTSIELINGESVQVIRKEVPFEIRHYNLTTARTGEESPGRRNPAGRGTKTNETTANSIIKYFIRPFDLNRPPMLRVGLIKLEETRHILMLDVHHIIVDGTSMNIMVQDFMALYTGRELPRLILQYKDFSAWQNKLMNSEDIEKQEKYWIDQFKDGIPALNMPTDFHRPAVSSCEGDSLGFNISAQLHAKLEILALETRNTMNILMMAVYNILLSKYTGQEDIVVGVGIAGRTRTELENIIGLFVNMIAMRNRPQKGKTFMEFLRDVRKNALQAYENQDIQYEELVKKLNLQGKSSGSLLFDTVFQLQNMKFQEVKIPGLELKPYGHQTRVSHYDLVVLGVEHDNNISITVNYSSRLFKASTIRDFTRHYIEILEQITENHEIKLEEISISNEGLKIPGLIHPDDPGDFEF